MEVKTISTTFHVANIEELSEEDRMLVEKAISQTEISYAPYSHFHVGAAVRLDNGVVLGGCNHENAAFVVSMCAERSALFAAGANYPDVAVNSVAIAARDASGLLAEPVSPCGVCRQAMVETESRYGKPLHILLYGTRHTFVINGISSLMPLAFSTF